MITKYHQFINESKNDPIPELNQDKVGIILMGTPGLGKSYFNKNYIQTRKEIKTFSTDDVSLRFTKDPNKYYGGASDLNIKMLLKFMDGGNSFIYDTTGTHPDQIFKIVQKARKSNYKIIFIHLVGPLELSLKQNQIRDRQVDPEYIKFSYQNQFPNMKTYSKQLDPDAYYIVYNKDNKYKFYKYKDGNILKRKVDKYIKEEAIISNNEYYEEIETLPFYRSDNNDKYISFDKIELSNLKFIKYKQLRFSPKDINNPIIIDFNIKKYNIGLEQDKIYIAKGIDEYYYVFLYKYAGRHWTLGGKNSKYYKCDQFDGLIKLLNDIGIK